VMAVKILSCSSARPVIPNLTRGDMIYRSNT